MNTTNRPIVFGEVLFDVLPDGKEILGGAPLNVAWHLQAFGYNPLVISRVGSDERGKHIKETLKDWNMDIQALQTDSQHPTGIVTISHEDSGPAYRIEPNQAYDHIAFDNTLQNLDSDQYSLLLHGTLALRAHTSHETLSKLREKLNIPVFADLNRRPPWWNASIAKETLQHASWVKVNESELQEIAVLEAFSNSPHEQLAAQLTQRYKNIEILFVTLGVQGSFAITQGRQTFYEKSVPLPATELDTIGAGDAFTAIAIIGLLQRWPIDILLRRANAFASAICRVHGATTTNRNIYEANSKSWTE